LFKAQDSTLGAACSPLAGATHVGQEASGGERPWDARADAVGRVGNRDVGVARHGQLLLLPVRTADVGEGRMQRQTRADRAVLAGVERPRSADWPCHYRLVAGAGVGATIVDAHIGGGAVGARREVDIEVVAKPRLFE